MSSFPSKYRYFSICDYSSSGSSTAAQQSRSLRGLVKSGKSHTIQRLFDKIVAMQLEEFDDFFNKEVSLIPVPRSHRQIKDAMWPSKVICDVICKAGFAREVLPLLERIENVTTSSMSSPENRPTVWQHIESLQLDSNTFFPSKVTLVDDLITQGRTLVACAQKILEKYPETEVRCFAILKTRNMIPDIPELVAPTFNYIDYYQSGKTFRHPAEQ